jgi:hypothetical protein
MLFTLIYFVWAEVSLGGLDWGGSAEAEIVACLVLNFMRRIERQQEIDYWFEEQFWCRARES